MSLTARWAEYQRAFPGFLERQRKIAGQARYGWDHPTQVSFVFGCQRSGTKMVMRILDNSPMVRIFHENHASAFSDFELRSDAVVRALVALNPAPAQIFKPICDSQRADELLANFPEANGVWVYRHHADVANSATEKWGFHQREVVAAIATDDLERWGWRTARLPASTIAEVKRVYRPDFTTAEGALLFWYVRNAFYFSLELQEHPRMLLVKYENLVLDPARSFPPLFAHVGSPFQASYIARVRPDSVGRKEAPAARPELLALCADLQARLDEQAARPVRVRTTEAAVSPPPLPRSVLLTINTLGTGGAERYVVTVANWLAARGVRVGVASSGGELEELLHPDVARYHVPLERVRGALPAAAARLRQLQAELDPDVVIANSLAVTWVARAADPLGRVPVVDVAHGWPEASYALVGPLLRAADRVVCVSPEVHARLLAAGLPSDRARVVFNGVDLSELAPRTGAVRETAREVMGAGPDDVLVLAVGRTSPQKAQHHIISLARTLAERHPRLRWAIVGAGQRDAELAGLVAEAGVGHLVRLTGLRADVGDLLGSADIYLSVSDWEGMSLTAIEAMGSALPIVSTATEGMAHLVGPENGLLVPVGDVAALGEAVASLAEDPARRAALGAASAVRARARFSHDRMIAELMAVVAEVVKPA